MQGSERSLAELFGELAAEVRTLLQKEMELARTEFSQIMARMFKDAAAIAAGGVVAVVGFMVLMAAAVLALGLVVPLWASALIIGAVLAGVGGFLIMRGIKDFRETHLTPEKTTETMKETAQWAKAQLK